MKHVIFDCDGVLVDSEPFANEILVGQLAALGLEYTPAESEAAFMGRSWAHCVAVVTARTGEPPPASFERGYRERLFEAFDRGAVPAVPGIVQALDAVDAAGLPSCVASSGDHERIRAGLRSAGLEDRFGDDRIFSATDVVHGKPAPDLFLHAAQRMGLHPRTTAVVEDSTAGAEAGAAAGMIVFGYAGRTSPQLLEQAGARPFHAMEKLPALLSG